MYRGDVEIVRMLLSAFADTHITDDDRRTPAMWLNCVVTQNCCLTYNVHCLLQQIFKCIWLPTTTACQHRHCLLKTPHNTTRHTQTVIGLGLLVNLPSDQT
jgi:hypothetical protein